MNNLIQGSLKSTALAAGRAVVGLALGLCVLAVEAAETTFKIATLSPEGTMWMTKMRAAAEEIGSRTEGRVRFKFYPGGIMGNDEAVMRKIRIGQLHGGAVTGGVLADIDADSQVYALPLLFRSLEEVDYVRSRMDTKLLDGLERKGFVGFGIAEAGFAYVMSAEPVRAISDMHGRKVWIPPNDPISGAIFEAAGLTPIVLPLADVLTGLQTGLIDTVAISPVGAIALQWHSRMKYVADTPLLYLYGTLIVDRKAFTRLSAADQAAVREIMTRTVYEIDRQNRADNRSAREALVKQGIEFLPVSPQNLDAWRKVAQDARRLLERRGIYTSATLATLQQHLHSYRNAHTATTQRVSQR